MKRILVIAQNTFQEMVREKFFLVVIFGSVALILLSLLLGSLSFDEKKRILADLGFAAIQVAALCLALFQGAYIIQKEVEKQTCLVLLAKPISRAQFILGKWLGLLFLLSVVHFALGTVLYFLMTDFNLSASDFNLSQYIFISLSLWLQTLLLSSLVLLFSLLVRPLFSLLFGFSIYLLGHWLNDLKFFAQKSEDETMVLLSKIIHEVVPQLYRFNWKSYYYLQQNFQSTDVLLMTVYLAVWTAFCLLLASITFKGKDIA